MPPPRSQMGSSVGMLGRRELHTERTTGWRGVNAIIWEGNGMSLPEESTPNKAVLRNSSSVIRAKACSRAWPLSFVSSAFRARGTVGCTPPRRYRDTAPGF